MDDMGFSDKTRLVEKKKDKKKLSNRGPMSLENPVYNINDSSNVRPSTSDAWKQYTQSVAYPLCGEPFLSWVLIIPQMGLWGELTIFLSQEHLSLSKIPTVLNILKSNKIV